MSRTEYVVQYQHNGTWRDAYHSPMETEDSASRHAEWLMGQVPYSNTRVILRVTTETVLQTWTVRA